MVFGRTLRELLKHFVYVAAVRGVDNFQVGGPRQKIYRGQTIDTQSYPVCNVAKKNKLKPAERIVVNCGNAGLTTQYLIIQSLDTAPERLCLGDVTVDVLGKCGHTTRHPWLYWCRVYAACSIRMKLA